MMQAVVQSGTSGAETLSLGQVPKPEQLSSGKIRIRVHATAVNRADILQRQGHYVLPPGCPEVLGLEAAGTVDAVGPDSNRFKIGDRVMALLLGGGYAEYAVVDERHVMPIPEGFSFEQAAAIPEVWITAYQLLLFIGKAKAGESVLIHAGASGVGTALIQLCSVNQIRSLVTVGTQHKEAFTKELGATASFNYNNGSFANFVKEHTGGKGADLILDPVGASYWQQNVESAATDGRWILYGTMGGVVTDGPLLGAIIRKRISLTGTTLRTRDDNYKAQLVAAFAEHALAHFSVGKFKPVISRVFHISQVADAHRFVEANSNAGKVILTWAESGLL